jgi:hypothetical protein
LSVSEQPLGAARRRRTGLRDLRPDTRPGRRVEPELVARLSIFVHAFSHWSNTGFGIGMPFAGLRTTSGSLVIRARSLSNFSTMTT